MSVPSPCFLSPCFAGRIWSLHLPTDGWRGFFHVGRKKVTEVSAIMRASTARYNSHECTSCAAYGQAQHLVSVVSGHGITFVGYSTRFASLVPETFTLSDQRLGAVLGVLFTMATLYHAGWPTRARCVSIFALWALSICDVRPRKRYRCYDPVRASTRVPAQERG